MFIRLLFDPVYTLLELLINVIPFPASNIVIPDWAVQCYDLIAKGLFFFPSDVFLVLIAHILFWINAQLAWAIFEWVYRKIPGVN